MSAVLSLKRSNSAVRYCFEADAEPGVLPRALELLAKRGLVPARVFAQADINRKLFHKASFNVTEICNRDS